MKKALRKLFSRNTAKYSLLFKICILVSSCYYDVEEELYPPDGCNIPATISYAADITPLLEMKCAYSGCHVTGGSGPGDFTLYGEVKAKVDDGTFLLRTITEKTMPPGAPLSNCEVNLLQAWLDQGAMNN